MNNINEKETINLLKTFYNLADSSKIKSEEVITPIKKLESKELESQLKNEATKNYHKRRQRLWDFLTDSFINVTKCLAIIIPVSLGLFLWAWTKHNGYDDVSNQIIVLSKRFFDMFIGFFLGNFLNSLFKKND